MITKVSNSQNILAVMKDGEQHTYDSLMSATGLQRQLVKNAIAVLVRRQDIVAVQAGRIGFVAIYKITEEGMNNSGPAKGNQWTRKTVPPSMVMKAIRSQPNSVFDLGAR